MLRSYLRPRRRILHFAIGLCLATGCARDARHDEPQLNLLLITIDTLRADHLSCYGYPRPTSAEIDRLAKEGAQFRDATVPRGQTWPSLTSLFTGEDPIEHGVRTNGQKMPSSRRTLATDLRDAGYATGAFLTNMVEAEHPGIDSIVICRMFGIAQWKWDQKAVRAGVSWLAGRSDEPWFAWFHLIDPHMPYAPPSPLDTLYRRGLPAGPEATLPEFGALALGSDPAPAPLLDHFVGLYDSQVNGVDAHVADILAAVDSLAVRDRTLVVLLADHGEDHFERNRYFGHSCSIYQPTLRVPLVIALPGVVRSGIVDAPIAVIDLRATLLDLLGAAPQRPVPGNSRAEWIREREPRSADAQRRAELAAADTFAALIEWAEEKPGGGRVIYAVRDARWTYIANPNGYRIDNDLFTGHVGRSYAVADEELHDLAADPWELANVVDEYPAEAARMRALLADRVQRGLERARLSVVASDSVDPATAEALRALGYVK